MYETLIKDYMESQGWNWGLTHHDIEGEDYIPQYECTTFDFLVYVEIILQKSSNNCYILPVDLIKELKNLNKSVYLFIIDEESKSVYVQLVNSLSLKNPISVYIDNYKFYRRYVIYSKFNFIKLPIWFKNYEKIEA